MHSLTNAALPSYDEKTNAVLLYSETDVTVISTDKIRTHVREAYKILRPEGRMHGDVFVYFRSPGERVVNIRGWCVPAQGKDYEVKEKDAFDLAPPGIEGGELIDDLKVKTLRIPAADPGNIVGYEYEIEQHPLLLQDIWRFQEKIPVREAHYSLQLPAGWEYRASWLNYPEVSAHQSGNQWYWTLTNISEIRIEPEMPPWAGVAGKMIVSFYPAGGQPGNSYSDWKGMGGWYSNLVADRVEPSEALKQQVNTLTASKPSLLEKMRAIADFVQHDVRYVAIELGIGGWQPHRAADVFAHRYGDCKDKATLMRTMLHEVGVESYYVVINSQRGSITPATPAYSGFDHVIIAIRLPEDLSDATLIAVLQHPPLGKILFFDPTDAMTPLGQIHGGLQANYGLLVAQGVGELLQLPQQPSNTSSILRTAKLSLGSDGTLKGEVQELRSGDRAWAERWQLLRITSDADRVKPLEHLLAGSLANFNITRASVINLHQSDQPFGFKYSFESNRYAKNAGDLLLVRPRVLGVKSSDFLETKEPRRYPVEFEGPVRDTDSFDISLPSGYEVDELPAPVDSDYTFASYHSKTEVSGTVVRYTRTFELKELSVPIERVEELRTFYRTIARDERSTVVLKPTTH